MLKKKTAKIQNEKDRCLVLLTVVSSQLSLFQKASCNFRFLPSPCLSTTNFHTYNIIQMENMRSWVPQQISLTLYSEGIQGSVWCGVKKFREHYSSPHTFILNYSCQPLAGSFALQGIYSTLVSQSHLKGKLLEFTGLVEMPVCELQG